MKRRDFITTAALVSGSGFFLNSCQLVDTRKVFKKTKKIKELNADIVVIGGGIGGCATALAACRNHQRVILVEETDWIGGQFSQQGVPPDEHPWIESYGAPASYREFRNKVRAYYTRNYPLTEEALMCKYFNPGNGSVSRLCHEPKIALFVLYEMFAPYISNKSLLILTEHKIKKAEVNGDNLVAVEIEDVNQNESIYLSAPYFVDATERGDVLPLSGTEYITGSESKSQTKEMHASQIADPENNQAFTVCFAMDYQSEGNYVIDKPKDYTFWHDYIPDLIPAWSGRLLDLSYPHPATLKPTTLGFNPEGIATGEALNLWKYRRIIDKNNFLSNTYKGDISIVNWPQNDYLLGNLIDVSENESKKHIDAAKQLNLSLLYWLQTEVPRPDGGAGWKGLRLRKDIMGTEDGMAKYPYIRESRRIKAVFTVLEEHVGAENRKLVSDELEAADFYDSVGIGYYHIDLHPSFRGNNNIDMPSLPFQIPLGALLPQRINNLLPANKNIGTTHITNGCYRLHPVEWSIGEAVGLLISFARAKKVLPRTIREQPNLLMEFQEWIQKQGIELKWKKNK